MLYSMIDANGMIVRARYTDNAEAGVLEGHRLLPDNWPEFDPAKFYVTRIEPVPNDAQAVGYNIVPIVYTDEQLAAIARGNRDELLQQSDVTQLPDYPITSEQKQAWVNYRQKLRELPEQEGFPQNIIWPKKP